MAVSLTRFSWWIWKNKGKDPVSNGSSVNSSSSTDFGCCGLREVDSVKLSAKKIGSQRRVDRKWQSREERRVDKQYGDGVIVQSDGGICFSGSESDGPDWSIGWVEPHGPEFKSDDEGGDDGFAVIVPCYRPGCKELVDNSTNQLLTAIKNLRSDFSSEGKNYMEWLSSVPNF